MDLLVPKKQPLPLGDCKSSLVHTEKLVEEDELDDEEVVGVIELRLVFMAIDVSWP
jgi:hypothetical protein